MLSASYCDDKKKPVYNVNEIASILRDRLKEPREKLKREKKPIPMITIRLINYKTRYDGQNTDSQVLDISFHPDNNVLELVRRWLEVFFDDDSTKNKALKDEKLKFIDEKINQLKGFYSDYDQVTLPLVSLDQKKSMTITKFHSGEGPKISMTLFKDGGYTSKDIDQIVQGYKEAFCVTGSTKEKLAFHFDDNHLQDKIFRFLEGNLGSGDDGSRGIVPNPFKMFDSDGNDITPSGNGKAVRTDDPIEELRSLGVEVFDPSASEELSWESLEGYEYVKKDIQDTVINALKFPEVYDLIAKKTRIVFESNRPKAILLEGTFTYH
jgi:hypothetical protein